MKIIIADKDTSIQQRVKEYLITQLKVPSSNIECCSDGNIVLQLLKREKYDILITELKNLDNVKGYALLSEIQTIKKYDSLAIIVISNISSQEFIAALRAITMDRKIHYIIKDSNLLVNLSVRIVKTLKEKARTKTNSLIAAARNECTDIMERKLPADKLAPEIRKLLLKLPKDEKIKIINEISMYFPEESIQLFILLLKSDIKEKTPQLKELIIASIQIAMDTFIEKAETTIDSMIQVLTTEYNYGEPNKDNIIDIQKCIIQLILKHIESITIETIIRILNTPEEICNNFIKEFLLKGIVNFYVRDLNPDKNLKLLGKIEEIAMKILKDKNIENILKIETLKIFTPPIKNKPTFITFIEEYANGSDIDIKLAKAMKSIINSINT